MDQNSELRSLGCPSITGTQQGCTNHVLNSTVNINGCDYPYTINYQICNHAIVASEPFINWFDGLNSPDPDCVTITNNVLTMYWQGKYVELTNYLNGLKKQAVADGQSKLLELHKTKQSFICPSTPCDPANWNISVNFQATHCINYCLSRDDKGKFTIKEVLCGTNCCHLITKFCVDQTTGNVCIGQTQKEAFGPCTVVGLPGLNTCNGPNDWWSSECVAPCDRL